MRPNVFIPSIIVTLLLVLYSSYSTNRDSNYGNTQEGKEFWLCFEQNYKNPRKPTPSTDLTLELTITSNYDSKVIIEIEKLNYRKEIEIKAGTVEVVKIDTSCQITINGQAQHSSIHITASSPITVYGLNRRFQTTDTFTALPVSSLGNEYRVMSYTISEGLLSQCAVIATENNTEIDIIPSCPLFSNENKIKAFRIKLQRGEVYQFAAGQTAKDSLDISGQATKKETKHDYYNSYDLTGTYFKANKKIAVFSGHQCAYVTVRTIACNHLVEQMLPLSSWGESYFAGAFAKRSRSTIRVLASYSGTILKVNSKFVKKLNAGEFWQNDSLSENMFIETNQPALVAEYSQGFKNGDSIGDPMMVILRPQQYFQTAFRIATPINGEWKHYINITVPNSVVDSVKIDGIPVDRNQFSPCGTSNFSIAQVQIDYGSHYIECTLPIGISSYGFGYGKDSFDAYGNM